MRQQVKKWGNSASIRIPAPLLAAAAMRIDQEVDVREDGGRIIIEPVAAPCYALEELVAGITADNLHEEMDFGAPVGAEIW